MTRFMDKSFSVYTSGDESYRDNWEATFGKRTSDACPHCDMPRGSGHSLLCPEKRSGEAPPHRPFSWQDKEERRTEAARQTGVEYYAVPAIPINEDDQRVVDGLVAKATASMKTRKLGTAEAPPRDLTEAELWRRMAAACPGCGLDLTEHLEWTAQRRERDRHASQGNTTGTAETEAAQEATECAGGNARPNIQPMGPGLEVSPNASVTRLCAGCDARLVHEMHCICHVSADSSCKEKAPMENPRGCCIDCFRYTNDCICP